MNKSINAPLAEIPLLDWSGPEFLVFFTVAWIAATVWSVARVRSATKQFFVPEPREPADPWDIAYLSAGPSRLIQLTILMLVSKGLVKWDSRMLSTKLVAVADDAPADLSFAERLLFNRIRDKGDKGLPPSECWRILQDTMGSTEKRLAANGLRPTAAELSTAKWTAVVPLLALALLGIAKLLIGLARDKPVLFLILLLILTAITLIIVSSKIPYLTPAGAQILENLRTRHSGLKRLGATAHASGGPEAALGFSLFGPVCLAGLASQAMLIQQMKNHIQSPKSDGSSGSGGCSSGCSGGGSSGCGGGGCGGCGGGA